MTCETCGKEYAKWLPEAAIENNLCLPCNEAAWRSWEIDRAEEGRRIEKIMSQGHSHHCACRQVWGDGECECDLYKQGYDPYAWQKETP
jgi:hypothetical protein